MELSVIIPTYNSLDTLKPLVKSLDNVYVVEDGQRKETVDWLKKRDKVIYHKENKGVATSWNDGIRQAYKDGSTYFAVFNDDIVVPKD